VVWNECDRAVGEGRDGVRDLRSRHLGMISTMTDRNAAKHIHFPS
jgi:hypothetical protein